MTETKKNDTLPPPPAPIIEEKKDIITKIAKFLDNDGHQKTNELSEVILKYIAELKRKEEKVEVKKLYCKKTQDNKGDVNFEIINENEENDKQNYNECGYEINGTKFIIDENRTGKDYGINKINYHDYTGYVIKHNGSKAYSGHYICEYYENGKIDDNKTIDSCDRNLDKKYFENNRNNCQTEALLNALIDDGIKIDNKDIKDLFKQKNNNHVSFEKIFDVIFKDKKIEVKNDFEEFKKQNDLIDDLTTKVLEPFKSLFDSELKNSEITLEKRREIDNNKKLLEGYKKELEEYSKIVLLNKGKVENVEDKYYYEFYYDGNIYSYNESTDTYYYCNEKGSSNEKNNNNSIKEAFNNYVKNIERDKIIDISKDIFQYDISFNYNALKYLIYKIKENKEIKINKNIFKKGLSNNIIKFIIDEYENLKDEQVDIDENGKKEKVNFLNLLRDEDKILIELVKNNGLDNINGIEEKFTISDIKDIYNKYKAIKTEDNENKILDIKDFIEEFSRKELIKAPVVTTITYLSENEFNYKNNADKNDIEQQEIFYNDSFVISEFGNEDNKISADSNFGSLFGEYDNDIFEIKGEGEDYGAKWNGQKIKLLETKDNNNKVAVLNIPSSNNIEYKLLYIQTPELKQNEEAQYFNNLNITLNNYCKALKNENLENKYVFFDGLPKGKIGGKYAEVEGTYEYKEKDSDKEEKKLKFNIMDLYIALYLKKNYNENESKCSLILTNGVANAYKYLEKEKEIDLKKIFGENLKNLNDNQLNTVVDALSELLKGSKAYKIVTKTTEALKVEGKTNDTDNNNTPSSPSEADINNKSNKNTIFKGEFNSLEGITTNNREQQTEEKELNDLCTSYIDYCCKEDNNIEIKNEISAELCKKKGDNEENNIIDSIINNNSELKITKSGDNGDKYMLMSSRSLFSLFESFSNKGVDKIVNNNNILIKKIDNIKELSNEGEKVKNDLKEVEKRFEELKNGSNKRNEITNYIKENNVYMHVGDTLVDIQQVQKYIYAKLENGGKNKENVTLNDIESMIICRAYDNEEQNEEMKKLLAAAIYIPHVKTKEKEEEIEPKKGTASIGTATVEKEEPKKEEPKKEEPKKDQNPNQIGNREINIKIEKIKKLTGDLEGLGRKINFKESETYFPINFSKFNKETVNELYGEYLNYYHKFSTDNKSLKKIIVNKINSKIFIGKYIDKFKENKTISSEEGIITNNKAIIDFIIFNDCFYDYCDKVVNDIAIKLKGIGNIKVDNVEENKGSIEGAINDYIDNIERIFKNNTETVNNNIDECIENIRQISGNENLKNVGELIQDIKKLKKEDINKDTDKVIQIITDINNNIKNNIIEIQNIQENSFEIIAKFLSGKKKIKDGGEKKTEEEFDSLFELAETEEKERPVQAVVSEKMNLDNLKCLFGKEFENIQDEIKLLGKTEEKMNNNEKQQYKKLNETVFSAVAISCLENIVLQTKEEFPILLNLRQTYDTNTNKKDQMQQTLGAELDFENNKIFEALFDNDNNKKNTNQLFKLNQQLANNKSKRHKELGLVDGVIKKTGGLSDIKTNNNTDNDINNEWQNKLKKQQNQENKTFADEKLKRARSFSFSSTGDNKKFTDKKEDKSKIKKSSSFSDKWFSK